MFQLAQDTQHAYRTRTAAARHDKQVLDIASSCHLDVVRRSVLGLVKVYNLLPQDVVNCRDVKSFQSSLTRIAKRLCETNSVYWITRYSPREPHHVQLLC